MFNVKNYKTILIIIFKNTIQKIKLKKNEKQ